MSAVTATTEREVMVEEFGALVADRQLTPGYSLTTERAYVDVDGELVWVHLGRMTLPPHLPGAGAIQGARLEAFAADHEAKRAAEWEAASAQQRELIAAERRRFQEMPDPAGWQVDRVLEREGRL